MQFVIGNRQQQAFQERKEMVASTLQVTLNSRNHHWKSSTAANVSINQYHISIEYAMLE